MDIAFRIARILLCVLLGVAINVFIITPLLNRKNKKP